MVKKASIGVLGIQGAISEHVAIMNNVLLEDKDNKKTIIVRNKEDLQQVDGLIIPGGESTTISRFLINKELQSIIKKRVMNHSLAVMGTCAGCILIAKTIKDQIKDIIPLELIDITVIRNAYGRQRESFEQDVLIEGFNEPFHAVFIRSPIIEKAGSNCQILSKTNNRIVMVKQDNVLGLSFHPELTEDTRIHRYFLNIVQEEV